MGAILCGYISTSTLLHSTFDIEKKSMWLVVNIFVYQKAIIRTYITIFYYRITFVNLYKNTLSKVDFVIKNQF